MNETEVKIGDKLIDPSSGMIGTVEAIHFARVTLSGPKISGSIEYPLRILQPVKCEDDRAT